jgi:cytochrome c peroxidase
MNRMTHVHTGCVQGVHAMCLLIWGAGTAVADPISMDDFVDADPAQARIGQLLFYDKILSGNRNISCGTCHHHDQAGGDGLSLGIGEGGIGVGPDRTAEDIRKRIPRNAPSLWNIGHNSIDLLFWDGRLEVSDQFDNGFDSPAEEWLPAGLDNIVAAQSLFPLTAQFEMAGNPGENDIAGATHDRIDAAWPIIEARIRAEPEYVRLFLQAFDSVNDISDITIVEIGNAMGAFITTEWRSFDSPYDAWLTGTPLPDSAERGRDLFFGTAGCASCHNGPLFTDQDFHALGLPAFGPGRTRSFDQMPRDLGRTGETDLLSDAYRFRTPSLRNIALTAPYGHNGAYPNLGDMIRHHLDPVGARAAWTTDMAALPVAPWMEGVDFAIQQDRREMERQQTVLDIIPVTMNETQVADIEAFLHVLTGNTAEERPLGRPATVPSGLPVD